MDKTLKPCPTAMDERLIQPCERPEVRDLLLSLQQWFRGFAGGATQRWQKEDAEYYLGRIDKALSAADASLPEGTEA